MLVQGIVSKVQALPDNGDGRDPLHSVSIEGLSCLCKLERVPEQGQEIVGRVSVQWRKQAKPNHWLNAWALVELRPLGG